MEEAMQREFPLLARVEGPAVVPPELMRTARTYREAVRLCWALRRRRRMTLRALAEEAGLTYQHVADYLNPDDRRGRRSLPGDAVARFEDVIGNTAVSQWHARNAALTLLEEFQAARPALPLIRTTSLLPLASEHAGSAAERSLGGHFLSTDLQDLACLSSTASSRA